MKKRVLGLVLSLILVICIVPVTNVCASTVVDSGSCGDNLTWTLDTQGTLAISGTGEMDNYVIGSLEDIPWYGIGDNIFEVIVNEGVTTISDYAFSLPNLKKITFPDSLLSIGTCAIESSCLSSITIPANVCEIKGSAFSAPIETFIVDSRNNYYCSNDGVLFNKDLTKLIRYPIEKPGTTYEIPNTVEVIGEEAFRYVYNLTEITIPDSVVCLENSAFNECGNLKKINIGKNVKTIDSFALAFCYELETLTLSKELTSIGNYAFMGNTSLKSVTIPSTIQTIGKRVFNECTALTDVYYKGTSYMWSWVKLNMDDSNDEMLSSVRLHYTDIAGNCGSSASWIIENGVLEIHGSGEIDSNSIDFYYHGSDILKVIIGNGVSSISQPILNGATYYSSNLRDVYIPFIGSSRTATGSSDALFGHLFGQSTNGEYVEATQYYSSTNYETYNIPTSLKNVYITDATQIPYGAFSGCSGLEYIELNEGITQIGQKAFADCGFLSVHIPKSVTRIGSDAFSGTDVEKLYVSINSYGHQYAVTNGYPYEFYDYYPVTGITMSEDEIDVVEGNTYALTATVTPDNATYNGVIWESSDKSVVTVNENGLVTAVSKGTATITATTEENNFTSSCVVNVLRPVTDIELNYSELNIGVGYTKTLTATVYPETASNKSVVWSTDDDSVATVSNGIVTAVGYGTTKIKATTVDGGYVAECTINSTIPVNGISLNKSNMEMIAGDTVSLVATVTPTDAFDKSVVWSSSNSSVATVENGLVTTKSAGTATITAKTNDGGKTASCVITVNAPVVNVTDITLNKCDISLNVGESETLVATITPSTATNKNVVWTSSNESIATVDENGKVTAKTNGIAIITATTADGNKEVTCTVTVTGESDNKIVIGDVNGDGEVDFADAIVVLKYDAGITTLTGDKLTAADTNGDGEVDFVDAIQILKYDGGLISSFN